MVKYLRDQKYDLAIGLFLPFTQMTVKSMEIPMLKYGTYMPEPVVTSMQQLPWVDMASNLPLMAVDGDILNGLGHMHIFNRIIAHIFAAGPYFVKWHLFYPRNRFKNDGEQVLSRYDRLLDDMLLGDGTIGYRDVK